MNLVFFATDSGWATGHGGRRPLRGNPLKVIVLYNRSRIFSSGQDFFGPDVFGVGRGSTLAGATLGDINSAAPLVENF